MGSGHAPVCCEEWRNGCHVLMPSAQVVVMSDMLGMPLGKPGVRRGSGYEPVRPRMGWLDHVPAGRRLLMTEQVESRGMKGTSRCMTVRRGMASRMW